jgi:hypothetical protein
MTTPILLAIVGSILFLFGILSGLIKIGNVKIQLVQRLTKNIAIPIGLILLLAGAWLYFPGWNKAVHDFFSYPPTPTEIVPVSVGTDAALPSPTLTPTATITLTPTNTPVPPAMLEIFPQVDGGEAFTYSEKGGGIYNLILSSPPCVHSGVYGLQLTYSLSYPAYAGWGVRWDNITGGHFDAIPFQSFNFWVKGSNGNEVFQIGLQDTDGAVTWVESYEAVRITTDWKQAVIPLNDFKGVNLASLENFRLNFNSDFGVGSVCIDDISFTP